MQDFSLLATAIGAAAIRVGFEDSVYHAPGKAAATSVQLVEKIVSLIHQIGYEVATPEEASERSGVSPVMASMKCFISVRRGSSGGR